MSLQVIFGDDEHTASEDAYSRVLKARKWVIFATALAVLLHFELIDAGRLGELLRIVKLPIWFLRQACFAALAYSLVQYCILLVQTVSVYDLLLAERFSHKQKELLEAARRSRIAAEDVVKEAQSSFRTAAAAAKAFRQGLQTSPPEGPTEEESAALASRDEAGMQLAQARQRLVAAQAGVQRAIRSSPGGRALFRNTERAIDAVRLSTPALLGVLGLIDVWTRG